MSDRAQMSIVAGVVMMWIIIGSAAATVFHHRAMKACDLKPVGDHAACVMMADSNAPFAGIVWPAYILVLTGKSIGNSIIEDLP